MQHALVVTAGLVTSLTFQLGAQTAPSRKSKPVATRIHEFMRSAADYGQFNGAILVVDRGCVVYEQAFGLANVELSAPNTTRTRFEIASMTKPMTAIAIMQLVQEGKVRLARIMLYGSGGRRSLVKGYPVITSNGGLTQAEADWRSSEGHPARSLFNSVAV